MPQETPTSAKSGLVRSASLTGYTELARALGLDPYSVLADVGLPRACLHEPDLRIPAEAVRALLELSAERSGIETFGLRLAESRRLSNLGLLALVLREEATLGRVLQAMVRFGRLHNEALFLRIERAGEVTVIREELIAGRAVSVRQATELTLGVLVRLLGVFMGPHWRPRRVCFAHAAPADRSVHRRVFGERIVAFDEDFNGLVCSTGDLDAPNPAADPVMARYARQVLESTSPGAATLAQEVRQLVFVLLPTGQCNAGLVAQHLGMDRRTVHRRLAREGESLSSLVDAARCELAERYLREGSRPLADVAALLGFSALSVFSRWHSMRFGSSPSVRRKGHRIGTPDTQ